MTPRRARPSPKKADVAKHPQVLLMDEDAKMRNGQPRHNKVATAMVVGLIPGDRIVGTVLHVALRDAEWVPLFKEGTSE